MMQISKDNKNVNQSTFDEERGRAREAGVQLGRAREDSGEVSRTREAGVQHGRTRETGTQHSSIREPAVQFSRTREAGAQHGGIREASTQLSRTRELVLCALMCALLVVSSFITVPFGPVPFTLQTFVVPLIILLMRPANVAKTTGLYLLMGAIGLPVFSGMQGSIAHLLGPTGGFLISYLVGGVFASVVRCKIAAHTSKIFLADSASLLIFLVICYFLGWVWLMFAANISAAAAFASGVVPFIFIDVFKYIAAFAVTKAVRAALNIN